MEVLIGRWLKEKIKLLSVAESCNGWQYGSLINIRAGSSDYFCGGVVAYSNQIKQSVLGVPGLICWKNMVVSQQVVESMAQNVMNPCILILGFATASPDLWRYQKKTVGTVWICVAKVEIKVSVLDLEISGKKI